MSRAAASGVRLTFADACKVLGMIERGDRHHDIAAWFGVNQGRIAEVKAGHLHPGATAAAPHELPPAGPYPSVPAAAAAVCALQEAEMTLSAAQETIRAVLTQIRNGEL